MLIFFQRAEISNVSHVVEHSGLLENIDIRMVYKCCLQNFIDSMYLFDASSLNFCDEAIHKLFWATLNCIYDQTDDETFNLWDTGSYKTRNGTERNGTNWGTC